MTLTVAASMTTPSRAGKAPRPVWNVSGPDLDLYAEALLALGGRKWRGAFSFFDDPTEAIARLGEQDRQTFAERQETARERAGDRADRLRERSAKHAAEAERASRKRPWTAWAGASRSPARSLTSRIPRARRTSSSPAAGLQSCCRLRRPDTTERSTDGVRREPPTAIRPPALPRPGATLARGPKERLVDMPTRAPLPCARRFSVGVGSPRPRRVATARTLLNVRAVSRRCDGIVIPLVRAPR